MDLIMEIIASLPAGAAGSLASVHPKKDQPVGIFAEHLDEKPAQVLNAHLASHGLQTTVVSQEALAIPPPVRISEAVLSEEGLAAHDSAGEKHGFGWNEVRVLFLSTILVDHETREWSTHLHFEGGGGSRSTPYLKPSDPIHKKDEAVFLEVMAASPALRMEIRPEGFNYAYLGSRLKPSAAINFQLLISDLKKFAPHAEQNPAFQSTISGKPAASLPGDRATLEKELRWYWWHSQNSADAGSVS